MRRHLTPRIRSLAVSLLVLACGALPAAAQGPSNAVVEYYHLDAIGSVRAVTDATGAVVRRHDYFPFGEEAAPPPGADQLRFAGKARDGETGLDYFQARYYASRAGRFTTVDPGHVGGNILDPQSWNAYAYARNNPFRFVDPTGTDYYVVVDGGQPFWIAGNESALQPFEAGGFSFRDGFIFNAAGRNVGSYQHFSPFARLAFDVSRTAGPGVNVAVGWGAIQAGVFLGAAGSTIGSSIVGLGIRTWAPALPAGMKVAEFGRLINWSNSRHAPTNMQITKDLIRALPGRVDELRSAGVTRQMALEWARFYAAEAARNPANPNAAARERLMRAIADALDR